MPTAFAVAAAFAPLLSLFGCGAGDSTGATGSLDDAGATVGGAGATPIGGSSGAGGASASGGMTGSGGAGSGGIGSGGATPGGASLLSACITYIEAFCNRRIECGVDTPITGKACFGSEDYCPDIMFSTGSTRTREGTLACAEAWKTLPCDDVTVDKVPPCATPGTRTGGETCLFDMQCASASCTVGNSPGSCGTCRGLAARDGPCTYDTVACPAGQSCTGTACSDNRPMTFPGPGAAGESCSQYSGCVPGYVCVRDDATAGAPAHCIIPPAAGAPCGVSVSSVTPVCADGLGCGPGNTCTVLPRPGESCLPEYPSCDNDGWCDGTSVRCVARSPAGSPCNTNLSHCANGLACLCTDAACSGGTCYELLGEGAPCGQATGRCVDRTECSGGTCVATDALTKFAAECAP